jgi:L-glutamine-phosphate cytidylyltransferase
MRGVILAAGKGSRLNGTAGDKPKCLVEIGGITLLERQIRALKRAGIADVVVVVGCQAERVRAACVDAVTFVENDRFAETNSLYSLWTARTLLLDGFVVLNCDVLFHPALLEALLASPHDAALLIAYREAGQAPFGDEEMKVKVRAGHVIDISKTMDGEADGENLGIVKFGAAAAPQLVSIVDRLIADGGTRDWAPRAFREYAQVRPLHAIGTGGHPWIEIDFPEDYRRAVRDVLPAIEATERTEYTAHTTYAERAGDHGKRRSDAA